MAERWRLKAFAPYALFFSLLLFPLFGHWTWGGGWLSQLGNNFGLGCGFVDFAGGGVVHALGGLCALAGIRVLGPRQGKFHTNGSANSLPGASAAVALTGVIVALIGTLGMYSGHTLGVAGSGGLRVGLVATSTLVGAMGGGIAAYVYSLVGQRGSEFRLQPLLFGQGTLGGMVALAACATFVSPTIAFVIGSVGGLLVCWALTVLELMKLDDVAGATAVHAGAGLWGLLAVGIFADGTYGAGWNKTQINGQNVPLVGILNGGTPQFVAQLLGCSVLIFWAWGLSYAFFTLQERTQGTIRCRVRDEVEGLDRSELDGVVSPDAQYGQIDASGGIATAAPPHPASART